MDGDSIKTGIDIIGSVPWGTHFCQFYQTKEDLLDTLVPYFKAGLENNEFCMWITAEPLSALEASQAMSRAMPDFADRMEKGQIEILPHTDWYLKGGSFDQERVLNGWVEKLNGALAAGYSGLRLTGNTFWLEKQDWGSFTEYEAAINDVIRKYRMLALCTYSLDKCGAAEVMDVIRNHEFALIRRGGQWELIENAIYRQAKESLERSEERFRNMFERSPVGIEIYDADGKLATANSSCLDIFGVALVDEVKGFRLFEDPNVSDDVKDRLRRGETVKYESLFDFEKVKQDRLYRTSRSGSAYLDVTITPLISGGEEPAGGYLVQVQDVTQRRRFEEALRESEARYRGIVETAQEGIVIGSPDGRFVFVNQRMADMLGYTKEEILGKTGLDFMDDDQRHLVLSSRRQLEQGQIVHEEYKFRRRDGSAIWTLCTAKAMYDETGRHLGNLAMHSDITERKRREQNILRLTQLYAVLSRANEAIVRIGDAKSLYSEICRIVAEESGFPLVWIGHVQEQDVVPVAWFGPAADYLKQVKVCLLYTSDAADEFR
ncbi:MAG: MEDS domain-containing protein, partial [Dehalococcoidia bacterium]|nr:MEDS domain-containing protein [Dehalococcoidia bacterium]